MANNNSTTGCMVICVIISIFIALVVGSCSGSSSSSKSSKSMSDKAAELGTSTKQYTDAYNSSKRYLDSMSNKRHK